MRVARTDSKSERVFVAMLLLLAAALRFFRLGHQSMWVDEMMTIEVSTPKDGYSIGHLLLHNIHGPLHSFVVFMFRAVGDSDAWLRVPSALAGIGAVGVFYAWVARWLGRRTARVAAVLLAIHPLHVHYSQEVRNYAFVFFFAIVSCYAFDRFTDKPGRRSGVAYALAMAAAALSNFTAAFIFAAHTVIYFLRVGFAWSSLRRWLGVGVVVLVLVSPWVYRVYTYIDVSDLVTPVMPGEIDDTERLRGETTVTWSAVPYTMYAFGVGFTLGPSLRELHEDPSLAGTLDRHWRAIAWVAVVFGGLLLAGASRALRLRRSGVELAAYLALPIVLTLMLNWQNAKAFNVRYVLVALPAYVCLLALGGGALGARWRVWVASACVVTMSISLARHYFDGDYAKEDVKRAMGYLEPRLDATRGDQCVFAPTVFKVVQRYYRGGAPVHFVYEAKGSDRSGVDAQLDALFAACNSFWYVRARPWVVDADGYVWRALEKRYNPVERAQFDGVEVIHFVPQNDGRTGG